MHIPYTLTQHRNPVLRKLILHNVAGIKVYVNVLALEVIHNRDQRALLISLLAVSADQ